MNVRTGIATPKEKSTDGGENLRAEGRKVAYVHRMRIQATDVRISDSNAKYLMFCADKPDVLHE